MKKIISVKGAFVFLGLLVIFQFVLLGILWHTQSSTNKSNQQLFDVYQNDITAVSNGAGYQPVTISPADKKIYLPQLGMSLVYSADTAYVTGSHGAIPTGPFDEGSISTNTVASAQQSQTQFNCSELVRIKFEAKADPYNPSETPIASVALANGKTLQVYAENQKACQKEWNFAQVNSNAVAALFKDTQSY